MLYVPGGLGRSALGTNLEPSYPPEVVVVPVIDT